MTTPAAALRRLYQSSVVWSWALNGFRVASGLLLLPLLLKVLPTADLGMHYIFLSLTALVPIVDFGFSVSVSRFVGYAMAGAREIKGHGLDASHSGEPNYRLLWSLLFTVRRLFGLLSLTGLVVMGLAGTWIVGLRAHETSSPQIAWLAWGLTLAAAVWEIYAGWWNVFLRSMNEVLLSARLGVLSYALKLVLAIVFLLMGGGLLAWPLAGLASGLIHRYLSRHYTLRCLGRPPEEGWSNLSVRTVLWPTSWRVGLQFLSSYLSAHANALICSKVFGLAATAEYGLSLQIAQILASMSAVWVTVKWPLLAQHRTRDNYGEVRAVLQPRLHLQNATYAVLAITAFFASPFLLRWQGAGKELLPLLWFGLLLLNAGLELQFSIWSTLLTLENRVPSLWPTVITNTFSVLLVFVLIAFTSLGLGAFVVAPLLTGCAFSYWFWPWQGAKSLQTGWMRFTFSRV